jgi:glycosyltransferase involved in cell wall biosynthesis
MSYGIPDERVNTYKVRNGKIVFAVIGVVTERKAQDIFIEAVNKLNYESAQYLIIGQKGSDDYCNKVEEMSLGNPNIKFWGELTREQMKVIYEDIDVVVCPSKEETMSITITEGMMYCKTCIVSDNAGMAEYVENGKNGFVFKSEDVEDLYNKMNWCIENKDRLNDIGARARKTYEDYFTMQKFGERLEKMLKEVSR